jgi:protein-S-isoprenylcysteine O-methyltransferase Ste14
MTEESVHSLLVWAIFLTAVLTFGTLLAFVVPYGRHYSGKGWGPNISNKAGWFVMETPSVVLFLVVYFSGTTAYQPVPLVFLGMWQCHYLNGTFVYPLRIRTAGKKMPLLVMGCALVFNSVNAYVNARFISELGEYGTVWLNSPCFLAGCALFAAGLALNVHSDNILMRLRKPGESGYAIPQGGAFRCVSCPNYLGEIVEWAGWALATWSPAGLAFFVYTAANLIPRARSHHQWYRARFPDYPASRKSLIPGLI